MQGLVAVATVVAGLCLAIRVLCSPPSWLGRLADRVTHLTLSDDGDPRGAAGTGLGEADQAAVEWGLLSQPFIRRRLDALAGELDRLDRDPDVFAKAFHTMVARSAREALLADASRLADLRPSYAGQIFQVELPGSFTGRCEELEL